MRRPPRRAAEDLDSTESADAPSLSRKEAEDFDRLVVQAKEEKKAKEEKARKEKEEKEKKEKEAKKDPKKDEANDAPKKAFT